MNRTLSAGIAEVDITPSPGLPMDGYAARVTPSIGAHDPLLAQVLLLEQDDKRAAIVAVDALAVSTSFVNGLRQDLSDVFTTEPEAVMICASHTHSGPRGLQDWFPIGKPPELNAALMTDVTDAVVTAAKIALGNRTPAMLTVATGEVSGVGGDRNRPQHSVDPLLTTLCFRNSDNEPLAVVFHYACHPTILGADNLLYSADFVGAARRQVREVFPETVAMFINGAAGNISTRFLRCEQSFEEVERLGRTVGETVVQLVPSGDPVPAALDWACEDVELPFRRFGARPEHSQPTGSERLDAVRAEGRALEAQLERALAGRTAQPASLCAIGMGPWILIGVPGEPFDDLAVAVRAEYPGALIAGYTNDYLGYFPTQAAVDMGTYEALSSPYDARAHELLQEAAGRLIRRLVQSR